MTWEIREQRYKTGEEIRLGDQIRYAGSCGIVTSVIYGRDCSSENQNGEGSDYAIALTVTTDADLLVFIDQAERDLEFLGRGFSKESSRAGRNDELLRPASHG
jgi:hypothetical protein